MRNDYRVTRPLIAARPDCLRGRPGLKEDSPEKVTGRPAPGGRVREETEGQAGAAPVIMCARCLRVITAPGQRTTVNGAHQHTFANPHGLIFEIGCFRAAPGCAYMGRSTGEFTWFQGYQWKIAVCAECLLHLGWLFTSSASSFHGLILSHLVGVDGRAQTS
ncbi:MAG: cereblon family protein [Desulfosudaceae bacterium]